MEYSLHNSHYAFTTHSNADAYVKFIGVTCTPAVSVASGLKTPRQQLLDVFLFVAVDDGSEEEAVRRSSLTVSGAKHSLTIV